MILAACLLLTFVFIFVKYENCKIGSGFAVYPGALPIIGNLHMLFGDNVHLFKFIHKLSVKLLENKGHFVILGPFHRIYALSDPEDCATVLNECLDKTKHYTFAKAWLGDGLFTANAQTWKKTRKFLNPMFNFPQVKKFLPIFNKQARRLVERFEEQIGKEAFNPEPDIKIVSLESICQTALGTDMSEHFTSNKEYVAAVDSIMRIFITRFKKIWLHFDLTFNWSSLKKKQDEKVKVINTLAIEHIKKRKLELESAIKDPREEDIQPFLDKVLSSNNEEFTEEKILYEINTFIVAGYETTANALVLCLMLLGHHQDVQAKLYTELKEVFGDTDRDVDINDIGKLVYLEAVMKESLRVLPVGPITARRSNEAVKLKNHIIPAGSDIILSIYAINRHPQWGLDADQFRPERWLDGTAPTDPNLNASFNLGKRNCIGKKYASLAFKTTIAHVIRKFHVSADMSKLVLKFDLLLKAASGQQIILKPRL